MKKLIAWGLALALILSALLLPLSASAAGKGAASAAGKTNSIKVVSISDTHLLGRKFIADTKDYQDAMDVEIKSFTDSEAIVDKQLAEVKKQKPDVLLLSGDLTKDGEYENHVLLAGKLKQLQKAMPNLKIYVINGNHDIHNEFAMLFNTKDGKAVPATRTTPALFEKAYDITYKSNTIIARYTPPEGEAAGALSYAARIKKGYTLIAIDSGRYSPDNTDSGEAEHETGGAIPESLRSWVVKQIRAARKRGDTVIGMQHHNFVPKFSMEDDILAAFLMNDWESWANTVADAGLHYMFTGHLHSEDVSRWVTDKGNEVFDIETGSSQTYPNPFRVTTFTRTRDKNSTVTETVTGKTIQNLSVSYVSPLDGKTVRIPDFTAYSKPMLYTPQKINAIVQRALEGALNSLPAGTDRALQDLLYDLFLIPLDNSRTHTLIDTFNYVYANHLGGTDDPSHSNPAWYDEAAANAQNGYLLKRFFRILVRDLSRYEGDVASAVLNDLPLFPTLFKMMGLDPEQTAYQILKAVNMGTLDLTAIMTPLTQMHISNYLRSILDSLNYDSNYIHDKRFKLVNNWQTPKKPYQTAAVNPPYNTGAVEFLVKTLLTELTT